MLSSSTLKSSLLVSDPFFVPLLLLLLLVALLPFLPLMPFAVVLADLG